MCKAKPFIKWVGGKRQLMKDIDNLLPLEFNNYYELFIGGGTVFFNLQHEGSVLNDLNPELTNVYTVVRDKVEELIESLKKHKNEKKYYLKIRGLDREESFNDLSDVEKASRFIFLNKTAFNGLYRVNSKGQHNVPFGKYKNPKILDEDNLRECSKALQGVSILNGDFSAVKDSIKPGDFVYLDPPYVPLDATSFTSYTSAGFDSKDQVRLKELCDHIHNVGAYFMLSNSHAPFVLDLYRGYFVNTVMANRAVNSKGDGRGKVKEVIVTNYKVVNTACEDCHETGVGMLPTEKGLIWDNTVQSANKLQLSRC